jgi:hypothetical protein
MLVFLKQMFWLELLDYVSMGQGLQYANVYLLQQVSGVSGYATPAYSPQGSRGPSIRDSPACYGSGISRGASLRDTSSREASIREASIRESIRESMRDAVSEVSDSVTNDRATETETNQSEEGKFRRRRNNLG